LILGSFPTLKTAVSASKAGVSYLRYRVQEAWAHPVSIVCFCNGYASKATFHGLLGMYIHTFETATCKIIEIRQQVCIDFCTSLKTVALVSFILNVAVICMLLHIEGASES
jgi:hypothetical protein